MVFPFPLATFLEWSFLLVEGDLASPSLV